VEGRIYLAGGRCCAAETTELTEPVGSERDLRSRLVDVCFTLARQPGGAFRFAVGEEPTWRVDETISIDDAVSKLDRLLEEWREIQAIIPSLEVRPQLTAELGSESIIVDQDRWRLLVRLDGRRTVRDVMYETQRGVMDVCNALKELIEDGAVEIAPLAEAPAPPSAGPEAEVILPVPAEEPDPYEALAAEEAPGPDVATHVANVDPPTTETPDPFATAEDATDRPGDDFAGDVDGAPMPDELGEEGDPRDRGALLRLFSALRDQ
jgi:hypothetical protein